MKKDEGARDASRAPLVNKHKKRKRKETYQGLENERSRALSLPTFPRSLQPLVARLRALSSFLPVANVVVVVVMDEVVVVVAVGVVVVVMMGVDVAI